MAIAIRQDSEERPDRQRPHGADRCRRLLGAVGLVASLCAAPAAWSANVVDVRVGSHPDYSRVVFELDAPAGYRIERHEPTPGVSELVVSLDAGTQLRGPKVGNSFVERVDIESRGPTSSIARVRLKGSGLRLKEMILANPPRIVLDVLRKHTPNAASEPSTTTRRSTPSVTQKPTARAIAAPPASPSPRLAARPTPTPTPEAVKPTPMAAEAAHSDTSATDTKQAAMMPKPVNPAPGAGAELGDAGAPTRLAQVMPPAARPAPSPTPAAGDESSFSLTKMAMAVGGVALVGVAGVMITRRRRSADVDDDFGDAGLDDDPFAGLGDTPSSEPMVRPVAAAPSASTGSASSAEMTELTRELERRISGLEARLEETASEREKLERQVAAQTEELRVQRAAIARTQRAVRNLSRPEEDGATEPALREPKPPGA